MVKVMIIGVWALMVAFGAVMLGHTMRGQPDADTSEPQEEQLEIESHSLELISVPVMISGKVDGYVLVKLSYLTQKNAKNSPSQNTSSMSLEPFIADEIYRQFFGAYSDVHQIELIKIDTIREQIIAAINQRFDQPTLKDIMIEQFNYITANQVRDINHHKSDS